VKSTRLWDRHEYYLYYRDIGSTDQLILTARIAMAQINSTQERKWAVLKEAGRNDGNCPCSPNMPIRTGNVQIPEQGVCLAYH